VRKDKGSDSLSPQRREKSGKREGCKRCFRQRKERVSGRMKKLWGGRSCNSKVEIKRGGVFHRKERKLDVRKKGAQYRKKEVRSRGRAQYHPEGGYNSYKRGIGELEEEGAIRLGKGKEIPGMIGGKGASKGEKEESSILLEGKSGRKEEKDPRREGEDAACAGGGLRETNS